MFFFNSWFYNHGSSVKHQVWSFFPIVFLSSRPGNDVTEAWKSSSGNVLGGEQREAEQIGLRTAGLHPEPSADRRRLRGRQPHGGRREPDGRRQRRRLLALLTPEDGERGSGTALVRLGGFLYFWVWSLRVFFLCVQLLLKFHKQQEEIRRLRELLNQRDVHIRQLELEIKNMKNSHNSLWDSTHGPLSAFHPPRSYRGPDSPAVRQSPTSLQGGDLVSGFTSNSLFCHSVHSECILFLYIHLNTLPTYLHLLHSYASLLYFFFFFKLF